MNNAQAVNNFLIDDVLKNIERITTQLRNGSMNTATASIQLQGMSRRLDALEVTRYATK